MSWETKTQEIAKKLGLPEEKYKELLMVMQDIVGQYGKEELVDLCLMYMSRGKFFERDVEEAIAVMKDLGR